MGSSYSSQLDHPSAAGAATDDDEEDENVEDDRALLNRRNPPNPSKEKVLEQEPEVLPCRASASPLSPQLSAAGTPRGPHIKVWDPCHVLVPPPPPIFSRTFYGDAGGGDPVTTEVYFITHGECAASLRPDLVAGRWVAAGLTGNGERQGRALAVFLNSQGVRFGAVYSSPLDRARATAGFVCRELGFAAEQIQPSDALTEMSQGQWEGCLRSDIYTAEMVSLIERYQPDFSPPSGESLRQVEFRMMEFLNRTILRIPDKLVTGEASMAQNELKGGLSRQSSSNSVQDREGPQWDLVYRLNRPGLQRKKSGKSRLQFVTTTGDNDTEDEFSPREINPDPNSRHLNTSIGIFTHSTPIKCLLAGILGSSPIVSQKFCIDDSSVTVLQHSLRTGWQIKRLNDTSHLRLL